MCCEDCLPWEGLRRGNVSLDSTLTLCHTCCCQQGEIAWQATVALRPVRKAVSEHVGNLRISFFPTVFRRFVVTDSMKNKLPILRQ